MSRATKAPVYPENLWDLMYWAKDRGVLVSLETNTSMHGGTDVKIWVRDDPRYYDQWAEKTHLGMRPDSYARWARKVEALAKEYAEGSAT